MKTVFLNGDLEFKNIGIKHKRSFVSTFKNIATIILILLIVYLIYLVVFKSMP